MILHWIYYVLKGWFARNLEVIVFVVGVIAWIAVDFYLLEFHSPELALLFMGSSIAIIFFWATWDDLKGSYENFKAVKEAQGK